VIYVWSEGKAAEEAKTRARHVAKIREEFEAVERNLNKYSLVTEKKIVQRLEAAKNRYAEGEPQQVRPRSSSKSCGSKHASKASFHFFAHRDCMVDLAGCLP
jgi:hypothetical protein